MAWLFKKKTEKDATGEPSLKAQRDAYVLNELAAALPCSEVEENALVLKEQNIRIRTEVEEVRDNGLVSVHFTASSPDWDREIFEVQVAFDETPESAIGKAVLLYRLGLGQTLCRIRDEADQSVTTQYAGKAHRFSLLISTIVSVGGGASAAGTDERAYLDLLQDELYKRIGDQRIVYCKIFCSRHKDDITIEVRLNNYVVPALGELLRPFVETWDAEAFGSQKQFLILRQDAETYSPYPYTQTDIQHFVRAFVACWNMRNQFGGDSFVAELAGRVKDANLAQELFIFIPEICAMDAFPEVSVSDRVTIVASGRKEEVFLTQIASFVPLWEAVQAEYGRGITNEAYSSLVTYSSFTNVLDQVLKEGNYESLEDIRGTLVSLTFNFDGDYILR
jgi:hypothetical protein